jgi:hypothetical protein
VGTIGNWGLIAAISVFLGLYGWARDMGWKPYPNKLGRLLAGWFLMSIAFGIWESFRSRAFGVPLVFITIPAAVGGVILRYLARPRGGQQAARELSAENHK